MSACLHIDSVHEYPVEQIPPLLLAHIGDAVYELLARQVVLRQGIQRINRIHLATVELVNAVFQAQMAENIVSLLSEAEREIFRRGRNTKSTPPRHTDVALYRQSTGLEALFGYLYLNRREERIQELFAAGLAALRPDYGGKI